MRAFLPGTHLRSPLAPLPKTDELHRQEIERVQGEIPHYPVVQIDNRADQHIDEAEHECQDVPVGGHHRVHNTHHGAECRQKQHESLHTRLLKLEYGRDSDGQQHSGHKEYVEREIESACL